MWIRSSKIKLTPIKEVLNVDEKSLETYLKQKDKTHKYTGNYSNYNMYVKNVNNAVLHNWTNCFERKYRKFYMTPKLKPIFKRNHEL